MGLIKDVYSLSEVRDTMVHQFTNGRKRGTTTYFTTLDPHFTWKTGEITLIHGIGNHGKTKFALELALLKAVKEGTKFGVFSPENFPADEFYDDLVNTLVGKPTDPLYKDSQMGMAEYEEAMDFINEHFFYVYPKDDLPTPEYINNRFLELVIKKGIKGCITDPFNQLDRDMSRFGRDDLYISNYCSEEKRFALDHDVYKWTIAHPKALKKNEKTGEYDCPDVYELAGGAMFNNKMDNIIAYHRPYYSTNKLNSTCEVRVQKIKKQKLVGIPGNIVLNFDRRTNRFLERNVSPFDGIAVEVDEEQEEIRKLIKEVRVEARNWYDKDNNEQENLPF